MGQTFDDYVQRLVDVISVTAPSKRFLRGPEPFFYQEAEPQTMEAFDIEGADPRLLRQPLVIDDVERDRIGLRDIGAPLDVSFVLDFFDPPGVVDRTAVRMNRVRTVSPGTVRGKLKIFRSPIIEVSDSAFRADGTFFGVQNYYWANNHQWLGGSGGRPDKEEHSVAFTDIAIAKAVAFGRRYEWRVALGHVGGASISFQTNPQGAMEIFRLRDIPEGRTRRAALRNWVSEHWRKRGTEDERKVRAHLRGATEFTWNGLRCLIRPSQFDLEKNAA